MLAAQWEISSGVRATWSWRPLVDGIVLPATPTQALANGAARGIDLIAGTTLNEAGGYDLADPSAADQVDRALDEVFGPRAREMLAAYVAPMPGAGDREVRRAVMTDERYAVPTRRLLDAQSRHARVWSNRFVWSYRFDAPSPGLPDERWALHGADVPLVWDVGSTGDRTGDVGRGRLGHAHHGRAGRAVRARQGHRLPSLRHPGRHLPGAAGRRRAGFQERVLAGPPPLGPGAPSLDRLIAYGQARIEFLTEHREIARAALDGRQHIPAGAQTPLSQTHIRMLLGQVDLGSADLDLLAVQLTAALDGPLLLYFSAHDLDRSPGTVHRQLAESWQELVRRVCRPVA